MNSDGPLGTSNSETPRASPKDFQLLKMRHAETPKVAPMAATHHHDDHREVLVHVDRGDDDVVKIDVHQPLFKVTFVLAGFLPTPQFLQCQWIRGPDVPVTAIPWPRAAPAAGRFERKLPIPTKQSMHETNGF